MESTTHDPSSQIPAELLHILKNNYHVFKADSDGRAKTVIADKVIHTVKRCVQANKAIVVGDNNATNVVKSFIEGGFVASTADKRRKLDNGPSIAVTGSGGGRRSGTRVLVLLMMLRGARGCNKKNL